jgi:hypothetical protein
MPPVDYLNNPSLDGLVALGRDGIDIQPTLLRVVTDLYVQKPRHSDEEEQHYTELALRLIDLVDAPTRAIVADKLAAYPATPAAVLQRLGRTAPRADAPAASPPPETPAVAAAPPAATSPSAAELSEIFLTATTEERRLILLNLDYGAAAPATAIAPQAAQDAVRRLESAALAHNSEAMAQEIERVFAMSRTRARGLVGDDSGEPVVVLARALDMPADVLQRILLCLKPTVSQSIHRVYELAALHDEIAAASALRLIAIWRAADAPARREPVHRAAYSPDMSARAQPAVRPVIRWEEHGRMPKMERG